MMVNDSGCCEIFDERRANASFFLRRGRFFFFGSLSPDDTFFLFLGWRGGGRGCACPRACVYLCAWWGVGGKERESEVYI